MDVFDHERLDVYQVSLEFPDVADGLLGHLRPKRMNLADELERASRSIVLNIAEGAGEFSVKEKARFYRMAKRSATECAAVLDLCKRYKVGEESARKTGRELLLRIVSMLVKMAKSREPE